MTKRFPYNWKCPVCLTDNFDRLDKPLYHSPTTNDLICGICDSMFRVESIKTLSTVDDFKVHFIAQNISDLGQTIINKRVPLKHLD